MNLFLFFFYVTFICNLGRLLDWTTYFEVRPKNSDDFFLLDKMWLCDEFEISFVQRKSYMREPLFVIVQLYDSNNFSRKRNGKYYWIYDKWLKLDWNEQNKISKILQWFVEPNNFIKRFFQQFFINVNFHSFTSAIIQETNVSRDISLKKKKIIKKGYKNITLQL